MLQLKCDTETQVNITRQLINGPFIDTSLTKTASLDLLFCFFLIHNYY